MSEPVRINRFAQNNLNETINFPRGIFLIKAGYHIFVRLDIIFSYVS